MDLVGGSVCHKIAIWELTVMIFLSKAMSKASGFTLTPTCLWQSILTTLVVQRILRSEELALFAISWRGKPLFSWCAPSFSVVWTIVTFYSCTSLLIKCTAFKKLKIMQPKSFFAKANMNMLHHFSKKVSLAPGQRKNTFQDSHLCLSFLWWYPVTISMILSLCTLHLVLSVPVQMKKTTTFLCKMETQELWSPVALCSGVPCLEQSSSPHPTQLLPLTVKNFPSDRPLHFCLLRANLIP